MLGDIGGGGGGAKLWLPLHILSPTMWMYAPGNTPRPLFKIPANSVTAAKKIN